LFYWHTKATTFLTTSPFAWRHSTKNRKRKYSIVCL
jgi:hypothetical protein